MTGEGRRGTLDAVASNCRAAAYLNIYLRRTDAAGRAEVLGRSFEVDVRWVHRLVRAEVDLKAGTVRFYRLRRREPGDQPLIREVRHRIKDKPFCE
jgi:hypothetical protein